MSIEQERSDTPANSRRVSGLLVVALVLVGLARCAPVRAEYYYARLRLAENGQGPEALSWLRHLEYMGNSAAIQPLVRLLRHQDPWIRMVAAQALRRYREQGVVDALSEVARSDTDDIVRGAAVDSLGTLGNSRAVPVLREVAGKEAGAYEALARLGPSGRDALLEAIQQTESHQVASALSAACRSFPGDRAVRDAARTALGAEAPEVRRQAVTCLGEMLGKEAAPILTNHLDDRNMEVRVAAAEQMARSAAPAGSELLIRILRDRTLPDEIRIEAAQALGRIRDLGAIESLREALNEASPGVRSAAQGSLIVMLPPGDPRAYNNEPPDLTYTLHAHH